MNNEKKQNWVIKYISKVISWFLLALLILIAGFLIYYVVAANIYASKGEEFKPKFAMYTIISPSMEPTINRYDVIFNIRVDDLNTLKEGDVITFISSGVLNEGMTVTHRIVGIVETESGIKFRTKGDNNIVPDSALVEPGNVLGRTLFKIPQLGRIQSLLATKGGWIFLVLVPALGIVIYDILKIFRLSKVKKKVEQSIEDNKPKIDIEQIQKEEERKEELKKKLSNKIPDKQITKEKLVSKKSSTKNNTSKKKKTKDSRVKNVKPEVIKMDINLPKKK